MGVATAIAAAGLAVTAASAVNSADSQRKALHAQQDALKNPANSTAGLEQSTTDLATQNAIASRNLENQLTPEVQQLRSSANTGLLNFINAPQDSSITSLQQQIAQNGGIPLNTPLLNAAIAKAQSDLALGGRLSSDQQNTATRGAAARAGQVGGNLGLGRDLTARDLGLTSAQVEQQRLMNASQLGGQEMSLATNNQSNLLNSLTALRAVHDDRYNQLLSAAQFGQSIQPPIVGLDPTAAANLQIARTNAQGAAAANQANVQGQQTNAYLNLAGQGLGFLNTWNNNRVAATAGIGAPTTYADFIAANPNSTAAGGTGYP